MMCLNNKLRVLGVLLVLTGVPCAGTAAGSGFASGWNSDKVAEFASGCARAIIGPARDSYQLEARKSGVENPKPFPEAQLKASVDPMCTCLSQRLASNLPFAELGARGEQLVSRFMQEALRGGECRPTGLVAKLMGYAPG